LARIGSGRDNPPDIVGASEPTGQTIFTENLNCSSNNKQKQEQTGHRKPGTTAQAPEDSMSHKPVLVVDLDGTLLASDMLYECFWSAFSLDWKTPFIATKALMTSRAQLKSRLSDLSMVDVATLPYRQSVIDYIEAWRQDGGETALVSAASAAEVRRVADHLGLFDHAVGSDDTTNLKGTSKAQFLSEKFADTGYVYVGDSETDLPVWRAARKAVTVNASPTLRASVDRLNMSDGCEHIGEHGVSPKRYLKAMRPHQWIKNVLVFVPMLAARQFDSQTFLLSLLAFVAFTLLASGTYILNDLLDLAADRAHPRKRNRPFASGQVPIAHATMMGPLLLGLGLAMALTINLSFFLLLAIYLGLTLAYSLYLKRQVIIDICVLAVLYTLRTFAGSAATHLPLSVWLLAFSVFLFFGLAAIKRQAELAAGVPHGTTTASGRAYRVEDLRLVETMAVSSGYVSVLVLALYVNSVEVSQRYATPNILLGICMVMLFWISHMAIVTHRGEMHDDPVVFATKDLASWVCLLLILGLDTAAAIL